MQPWKHVKYAEPAQNPMGLIPKLRVVEQGIGRGFVWAAMSEMKQEVGRVGVPQEGMSG